MQKILIKQNEDTIKKRVSTMRRWLYRGQRPNWIARILNKAWATVVSLGVTSNNYVTLEVIGRKSGRIVSFPLVMVVVDGQRYLVSMLGVNAQWVLNVRATGGKAVINRGGREDGHTRRDSRQPACSYLEGLSAESYGSATAHTCEQRCRACGIR